MNRKQVDRLKFLHSLALEEHNQEPLHILSVLEFQEFLILNTNWIDTTELVIDYKGNLRAIWEVNRDNWIRIDFIIKHPKIVIPMICIKNQGKYYMYDWSDKLPLNLVRSHCQLLYDIDLSWVLK